MSDCGEFGRSIEQNVAEGPRLKVDELNLSMRLSMMDDEMMRSIYMRLMGNSLTNGWGGGVRNEKSVTVSVNREINKVCRATVILVYGVEDFLVIFEDIMHSNCHTLQEPEIRVKDCKGRLSPHSCYFLHICTIQPTYLLSIVYSGS